MIESKREILADHAANELIFAIGLRQQTVWLEKTVPDTVFSSRFWTGKASHRPDGQAYPEAIGRKPGRAIGQT